MKAITYKYQSETVRHTVKITLGTVAAKSQRIGIEHCEPLLVSLDSMLRYAKAHEKRYGSKLKDDYVLGPYYLSAITGLRNLLCGEGGVAMEQGISTDSKDNGVLEGIFWDCMKAGGFEESDI